MSQMSNSDASLSKRTCYSNDYHLLQLCWLMSDELMSDKLMSVCLMSDELMSDELMSDE